MPKPKHLFLESLQVFAMALWNSIYQLHLWILNLFYYMQHIQLLRLDAILLMYYRLHYSSGKHRYEKTKTPFSGEELTYGETSFLALAKAIDCIPKIQRKHRFIDLGCGRGRLVFFANIHFGMPAIGIDILPTYIKVATQLAKRFNLPDCRFANANFLNDDFKLPAGSIYFIAGTCLSGSSWKTLIRKLQAIPERAYTISTSIPIHAPEFKPIQKLVVPFSWGKGTLYIQQKVTQ